MAFFASLEALHVDEDQHVAELQDVVLVEPDEGPAGHGDDRVVDAGVERLRLLETAMASR